MAEVVGHDYMSRVYWMVAGGAIGIATMVNVAEKALCWHRLRAAQNSSQHDPARPKALLTRWWATLTAISREITYCETSIAKSNLHPPPLGRILLVLANFSLLIGICYHGFDTKATYEWERISLRAAHLTLTQLPLVFLLAGKTNIIAFLTGSSYERLNWIHRWASRCMFITSTIHFLTYVRLWVRYDGGVAWKLVTDKASRTGLGTWCVLLWMFLSSFAPLRRLGYEFFVIQHLVSMVAFITMCFIHIPKDTRVYVWIPVALYLADRTIRFCYCFLHNIAFMRRGGATSSKSLFSCQATFTPLPSRGTKVTIPNPPFSWAPGQHVLFSCHSLIPLQSHPFTITSLPSDGKVEFLIQAQGGATDKLHCHCAEVLPPVSTTKAVILDGPYGRIRPLAQFDTVVLLAGSSGAGFTVPLLRDLVQRANLKRIVTRRIKAVWVVKNKGQMEWFEQQIKECLEDASAGGRIDVEVSIYVTCDEKFTQQMETPNNKTVEKEATHLVSKDSNKGLIEKVQAKGSDSSLSSAEDHPAHACCCRAPIANESSTSISSIPVCGCGPSCGAPPAPSIIDPSAIDYFTGRPTPRVIIRKELERALGESAVLACGPCGLIEDVRRDVVHLSDERAVHKGTGAQGIYLHTESFCW